MDSGRANALKRKQELLAELEQIDLYLALDERFSGAKPERNETPSGTSKSGETQQSQSRRGKKRSSPAKIAATAMAVIREKGRPLTRSELVEALEKKGLSLHSKDKPRYVGTIIWRQGDTFVNLEGHGYWLKGEPYAPVGYPEAFEPH